MSVDERWDEAYNPALESQPYIVPWTVPLALASLGVSEAADRETVLAAGRDAIDNDELSLQAARVLAENGYPELDPDATDDADDLDLVEELDLPDLEAEDF